MKEVLRRASIPTPPLFPRGAAPRAATTTVCALILLMLCSAATVRAATFIVNSTSDVSDANAGNGVCRSSNATGRVCSLRAAIEEANALTGTDIINFQIANASLTGGVAVITVINGTLTISEAVTIDGTTQTTNTGDTNPGSLGVGGFVGTGNVSLSTVSRPEVQVVNGTNPATVIGFDIQASNCIIRGLSIYGFGTASNSDASANIRVGASAASTIIERNFLGLSATAANFNTTGTATSTGDNIRVVGGDFGTIQNNLIGHSNGKGIQLGTGSNNWTVTDNEVRDNGINVSNLDGIDMENGSGSDTVTGNFFIDNEAEGIDSYQSSGSNLIENNTIRGNGVGAGANVETAGIRLYGTGNTVRRNIITLNFGAGVQVTAASSLNTITQNSISANGTIRNKANAAASGQIGIDLLTSTDNENMGTSTYVTLNDSGDGDAGGNGLLNFPVITSAIISTNGLTIAGYARPTSAIEFFIAAPDPRGFGEGLTYLVTLNEGSASDADATTGTYTSPLPSGQTVGTDNTNRFKFTIAVPGVIAAGSVLTATATAGSNTSEFSNNAVVANAPDIDLRKCVQSGASCIETTLSDVRPNTDLTYVITFTNRVASGGLSASGLTVVDIIPPGTVFKVGSMNYNRNTTSLGIPPAMEATNVSLPNPNPALPPLPPPDPDPSWGYTPTGTYDPAIKFIRWRFTSGSVPSGTSGTVTFIVHVP
jgi:CSLREA domain-containing protein